MSAIPIALEGSRLSALVVGGGIVGTRKAAALAASGAKVRVIAPAMSAELESLAATGDRVTLGPGCVVSQHVPDDTVFEASTRFVMGASASAGARSIS